MIYFKKAGQIVGPLLLSFVTVFISLLGFTTFEEFIYRQVFSAWSSISLVRLLFSVLCFVLIMGIFIGLTKLFYKDTQVLGFSKKKLFKNLFTGYLSGVVLLAGITLGYLIFSPTKIYTVWQENAIFSVLGSFIFYLFQGTQEEVITRGFIQGGIAKTNSLLTGVIASSVFFTLMHLSNTGGFNLDLLTYLFIALAWSLLRILTGNTWFVAAMHGAYNFSEANLFGLANSFQESEGNIFKIVSPKSFDYMHFIGSLLLLVIALILISRKRIAWLKPFDPSRDSQMS